METQVNQAECHSNSWIYKEVWSFCLKNVRGTKSYSVQRKCYCPTFCSNPTVQEPGVTYPSQALSREPISFSKHKDLWIQSSKGFPKHSEFSPYLEKETQFKKKKI